MRVIEIEGGAGPAQALKIGQRPDPVAGPGQVVIQVRAAGVNRPDLLQRQGGYPPPPGASDVLGLDVAGEVNAKELGHTPTKLLKWPILRHHVIRNELVDGKI